MACTILGIKFKDVASEVELTDTSGSLSLSQLLNTLPDLHGNQPHLSSIPEADDASSHCSSSTDSEYYMYSRIETHMHISMSLYYLNTEGCNIIRDLERKKSKKVNAPPTVLLINIIVSTLKWLVTERRPDYNIYCELLNNLDGVLFEECKNIEIFVVKEEEFTLESMYYKQETWVNELDDTPCHIFQFDDDPTTFSLGECSYLLLYFQKYSALIDMIEATFNDKDNIQKIICKIRDRLATCVPLLDERMHFLLSHDVD